MDQPPTDADRQNDAGVKPAGTTAARRPRRWRRVVVVVFFVVLGLLIAAPYAMRLGAVRQVVFAIAFRDLNGTVTADRARLGWFSPPALYGFEIRPHDGPPVLQVDALEGDVALWRMIAYPRDLGEFRLVRPTVRSQVDESGSNIESLLPGWGQEDAPPAADAGVPNVNVSLRIEEGRFVFEREGGSGLWEIGGIDVASGIRRAEGSPELVVEKGVWLDHVHVEPEMCNDFLMYIAPVLARTTKAHGEFSIEMDGGFVPLAEPERGALGGRLKIHALGVGPGALARTLADRLGMPPSLLFADETTVEFELRDGRVHHDNLAFTLTPFSIRTEGSVGLDETLDLRAEISLPEFDTADDVQAPLRRALGGRTFHLAIGGTVDDPQIDARQLADEGLDMVLDAVRNVLDGGPVAAELLKKLQERRLLEREGLWTPRNRERRLRPRLFRRRDQQDQRTPSTEP